MKKIIIVFYLCLLSAVLVYAQTEADTACRANLEKIFKALELKIKFEAVEYVYELSKKNIITEVPLQEDFGYHFEQITGVPLDSGDYKGLASIKIDMADLAKQFKYYPKVNREYRDFIQHLKSEKELCLKCIDAELAKGNSSEYANKIVSYTYDNLTLLRMDDKPVYLSKLDYLRVFKEFILIDNKEYLPSGVRAVAYLQCGLK
jgi:hypothetical protein